MISALPRYAELATTTNFSFLRGASHPEEFVAKALDLEHVGLGIADRNSLAGVVRAFSFLKVHKIAPERFRLAIGARLVFADKTPPLLCYPQDRAAYGRLCRLLTRGYCHPSRESKPPPSPSPASRERESPALREISMPSGAYPLSREAGEGWGGGKALNYYRPPCAA